MSFQSDFAKHLASGGGIYELMEDLGEALNVNPSALFLGGGNPARIDEFEAYAQRHMQLLGSDTESFHRLIGVYQSPRGSERLIDALAKYFRSLGWPVNHKNICLTSGSQTAFFILFNLFSGTNSGAGLKQIALPMVPEYLGYADQSLSGNVFRSFKPRLSSSSLNEFEYHCDFDQLEAAENIGAFCLSRPTNPSGNVLSIEELNRLGDLADRRKVPLMVDCAYGAPFPGVIYEGQAAEWQSNRVFVLSLSKLGLPGVRTGIVVANEDIVDAVVKANTVMSLANGNLGPDLFESMLREGQLDHQCRAVIRPFYQRKRDFALSLIEHYFKGIPYRIHKASGAFFLWLWFEGLPVSSTVLYESLKQRQVLIMDGKHFFFEHSKNWAHASECVRITYCQSEAVLERAIKIFANELHKAYAKKR